MTPGPHIISSSAKAIDRLRLKPPKSASGFVDGAWWPRSDDLMAEVPALAVALADRIGPVWRVAFPLASWARTARRMIFEGRLVRLEGFSSQNPHLVHVTGGTMCRVTLLVIPPKAGTAAAEEALATAAGQNNAASPETILIESGVLPSAWVPVARDGDVARRESDAGGRRSLGPAPTPTA